MVYGSPDVTTKYGYDGAQVIEEYDVNNTMLRRYFYGPNIDEPIAMIDHTGGNKLYYYYFDPLGSVVALSDANGMLVERYEYDVFGEPTIYDANDSVISQSSVGNPYMFTGRRFDEETNLYYYRARYYKADIGRFLQPDPIGYRDSMNLYTYVINNPVRYVDPGGRGLIVPGDAFDDHGECGAIEGYYRHCASCCRLHMWLGAIPTYLINLEYGGDWPCEGDEDTNHASDRKACKQGIKNRYKVWDRCRTSCKKSTKKAIKKHCPPGYEWKD